MQQPFQYNYNQIRNVWEVQDILYTVIKYLKAFKTNYGTML